MDYLADGVYVGTALPCVLISFQACRVQPSVPELSLLVDGSFSSKQLATTHVPPPSLPADRTSAAAAGNAFTTTFSAPPHRLHSTPNSNLQQPCTCCPTQTNDCTSIFSPGFHLAAAPPPSSLSPAATPSLYHQTPPILSENHPTSSDHALSTRGASTLSHSLAAALSTHQPTPFKHFTPPLCHKPPVPLSYFHNTPLSSTLFPPPVMRFGDSPSPHPSSPADPLSPLCPTCGNQCCNHTEGAAQSDTYQLLLHQDQQLRLLQAQVKPEENIFLFVEGGEKNINQSEFSVCV